MTSIVANFDFEEEESSNDKEYYDEEW